MKQKDYVKTIVYNDVEIKLGFDDYGETYYIEYEEDGKIIQDCVGPFESDYMGYIRYKFNEPEKHCEYFEVVIPTETTCCPHRNKSMCLKCDKAWTTKEIDKINESRNKLAKLLNGD